MASILLSTTGNPGSPDPVVIDDLGEKKFPLPTTDYELVETEEFTDEEIRFSGDIQQAIDDGWVILKDSHGNTITDIATIGSHEHPAADITDFDTEVSNNTDVDGNTTARHSHSNKSELDLVSDGDHDVRTDNPHTVTAGQAGADPAGTASTAVTSHESTYDHSDLHASGSDDQVASGVPYTPATGGDWVDPDPTEVAAALDDAASRVADLEGDTHAHSNKSELDLVSDGDHDVRTDNPHDVTPDQQDYVRASWDTTKLDELVAGMADHIETYGGTGRFSPEIVLSRGGANQLDVASGDGCIAYDGFHRHVEFTGESKDTTGFAEGTWWVYVDDTDTILYSLTEPNRTQNIVLGFVYHDGGQIGLVQQCSCMGSQLLVRVAQFSRLLGAFVADGGGLVQEMATDLKVVSPACNMQDSLLNTPLVQRDSDDIGAGFYCQIKSSNFGWNPHYWWLANSDGKIPTGYWNDTSQNAFFAISADCTFSNGSPTVSTASDLQAEVFVGDMVGLDADGPTTVAKVQSINATTITLETNYGGTGGTGASSGSHMLPNLTSGYYAKHLIARSQDGSMHLLLSQAEFATKQAAIDAGGPDVPEAITLGSLNMAFIIVQQGATDLTDAIYDIRPLPFHRQIGGGQAGGGVPVIDHGDLTGLGDDDHTQYLQANGARDLTAKQSYNVHPTFNADTELVDKKYVDDKTWAAADITDFDTEVENNTEVAQNTTDRHTHANKAELDLVTDGDHDVRTDNPHATDLGNLGSGTVTELNTLVTDATIDGHTHGNKSELDLVTDGDHDVRTDNPHSTDIGNLGSGTITELNTAVTDATIDGHTHGNKVQLDLVTDGDHDVRTDNPHSVTATQAGYTPADGTDWPDPDPTTAAGGLDDLADRVNTLEGAGVALHASTHQHSGTDEIATATAAANAIPKADGSALLDTWISDASTTVKGKIEIATLAEVNAGAAMDLVVTPYTLDQSILSGTRYWTVSFTNSSGLPYQESTSAIYEVMALVTWPGSSLVPSPTNLKASIAALAGDSMDVRVYDITNATVIAELTGVTDTSLAVKDLGTLTNVTSTSAIWEVQIRGVGNPRKAVVAGLSGLRQ